MDGKHLKQIILLIIIIFIINLTLSTSVTAETTNISLRGFYDFLYEQKYIIWIPIILLIIILPIIILKIKKKRKEKMYYLQKQKETENVNNKLTELSSEVDFDDLRKHIDEILKK